MVGRRVLNAGVQDRVTFFIDDTADADRAKAIKRVDPRLWNASDAPPAWAGTWCHPIGRICSSPLVVRP